LIRPLRAVHRAIWTLLALLLPALVVLALARRHTAAAEPLPPQLSNAVAGR
jgi:hypothetical protein